MEVSYAFRVTLHVIVSEMVVTSSTVIGDVLAQLASQNPQTLKMTVLKVCIHYVRGQRPGHRLESATLPLTGKHTAAPR